MGEVLCNYFLNHLLKCWQTQNFLLLLANWEIPLLFPIMLIHSELSFCGQKLIFQWHPPITSTGVTRWLPHVARPSLGTSRWNRFVFNKNTWKRRSVTMAKCRVAVLMHFSWGVQIWCDQNFENLQHQLILNDDNAPRFCKWFDLNKSPTHYAGDLKRMDHNRLQMHLFNIIYHKQ